MNGGVSSKCLGSFSVNMFMDGVKHFYCSPRNLRVSGNKNKNNSLQFGNYAVFRLSWPVSYLLYNPSQRTTILEILYRKTKLTKPGKPLKMIKFLIKHSLYSDIITILFSLRHHCFPFAQFLCCFLFANTY